MLSSTPDLAGATVELVSAGGWELRLRRALEVRARSLRGDPDRLPALLRGADAERARRGGRGVIPVQCEYLALEGLGQLMDTLALVRES